MTSRYEDDHYDDEKQDAEIIRLPGSNYADEKAKRDERHKKTLRRQIVASVAGGTLLVSALMGAHAVTGENNTAPKSGEVVGGTVTFLPGAALRTSPNLPKDPLGNITEANLAFWVQPGQNLKITN